MPFYLRTSPSRAGVSLIPYSLVSLDGDRMTEYGGLYLIAPLRQVEVLQISRGKLRQVVKEFVQRHVLERHLAVFKRVARRWLSAVPALMWAYIAKEPRAWPTDIESITCSVISYNVS